MLKAFFHLTCPSHIYFETHDVLEIFKKGNYMLVDKGIMT